VSRFGLAVSRQAGKQKDLGLNLHQLSLLLEKLWFVDTLVTLPLTVTEAFKRLSSLPILTQNQSSGHSVSLGIVPLSPTFWYLSPRHYLFGDNSVLNS